MQTYVKIGFRIDGEQTADLVVPFEEFSRLILKGRKTPVLLMSAQFATFEEAFAFSFEGRASE